MDAAVKPSMPVRPATPLPAASKLPCVLSDQLMAQQQLLVAHHQRALLLVEEVAQESQMVSDAVSKSQIEAQRLRDENAKLKTMLHISDDALPSSVNDARDLSFLAEPKRYKDSEGCHYVDTLKKGSPLKLIGEYPIPPARNRRPATPADTARELQLAPSFDVAWDGSAPRHPSREKETAPLSQQLATAVHIRKASRMSLGQFLEGASHQEQIKHQVPRKGVFHDAERLKDIVRKSISKTVNDVEFFYKTTGIWQRLARSQRFEQLTLAVIMLNSIWMALETDYNSEVIIFNAHPVFIVMEFFFCGVFTMELVVRTLAFQHFRNVLQDRWYPFDFTLVFIMIVDLAMATFTYCVGGSGVAFADASVLKVVKLMRVLRVTRMARLLRAVPELMILIKGMAMAARSVVVTLSLMVFLIYIFGIVMTQLTVDTELGERWYTSVPRSMTTLFLHGCFAEDLPNLAYDTGGDLPGGHILLAALLMLYVLIASLTVMNMLVGVLVDVVSTVSKVEKVELSVATVKAIFVSILQERGKGCTDLITQDDFKALLQSRAAAKSLVHVGVDVVALVELSDFLFEESESLPFSDFMEAVLQLRGSNVATVKDIVDLRRWIGLQLGRLHLSLGLEDDRKHFKPDWMCEFEKTDQTIIGIDEEADTVWNLEEV